jgi:ubiquinone biosynthesis protein UbiJ
LKYPGVADETTRALVNLRLQDIQPFAALDWESAITAQFELGKDRTLLLRGVEKDGEYWLAVTLGSVFSDADRLAFELRDDVERWAYKVGQYHYEQLARAMTDFVAEPATEATNSNET